MAAGRTAVKTARRSRPCDDQPGATAVPVSTRQRTASDRPGSGPMVIASGLADNCTWLISALTLPA